MKLLLLLIASSCLTQVKVESYFGNDYAVAKKKMVIDGKAISKICNEYEINQAIVKSIVFPELIRNSVFQNLIEEKALELGYVQYGSSIVDFSIGDFQIKPSFAQKVEELVKASKQLSKKYSLLPIINTNSKTQRLVRVQRLKSVEWQIRYVCSFIDICEANYSISKYSTSEKIKFLATAYNVGLKDSMAKIEIYYPIQSFPYGQKYEIDQLAYWEVSLDYYLKYSHVL